MRYQRTLPILIWSIFATLLWLLPPLLLINHESPMVQAQSLATVTPVPTSTRIPAPDATGTPLQLRTYTDAGRLWQVRYAPELFLTPQRTTDGFTIFRTRDRQAFFAVDTFEQRPSAAGSAQDLRTRALAGARTLSNAQVSVVQELLPSDRWQIGMTFAGREQGGEAVYEQYGLSYGDTRVYGVIIGYRAGAPQEIVTHLLAMRESFQGRTFTAAFGVFVGGGFYLIDPTTNRALPVRTQPATIPRFEILLGDPAEQRGFTIRDRSVTRNNGELLTDAAFYRQFPGYADVLPNLTVSRDNTRIFFSACNIGAVDSPERRCDGFALNLANRSVSKLAIGGWQAGYIAPDGNRAVGMIFVGSARRPDGISLYRAGENPQRISSATLRNVAWLPDGRFVFSTADDPANRVPQRLLLSSADGRDRRFLVRNTPANELAATPDGRWLAYVNEETGELWVLNLANSRRARIANLPAGGQGLLWLPGS